MKRGSIIDALRDALGPEKVLTGPADLLAASHDESDMKPEKPVCVCRPSCAKDAVAIVRAALEHGVPVTARGAGTSLEGSSIPTPNAVVVDFSTMDQVIESVPEEQRVTVGPGIVYDRLNRLLRQSGLFFPPSPGGSADVATIGGMVSTNASGIYALKYGGTRRWVSALEVVTGRGDLMRVGTVVPKTTAGFDLKDLFVGAEGCLGLITGITLRLAPVPHASRKGGFLFPDVAAACAAASEMAAYIPEMAALELTDADTMDLLRAIPSFASLPKGHALFIEVHGRAEDCEEGFAAAEDVAGEHLGIQLPDEIPDPWELRHRMTGVIREAAQPDGVVRTDCAVPLLSLPGFVSDAKKRAMQTGRGMYVFGHVGLGILHFLMPLGGTGAWSKDEALREKARLGLAAVEAGGTVSGEHGIGLGNREILGAEHPVGIEYMRAIKSYFDPANLMNPDKVVIADGRHPRR
ncbi:MAG: FAD-binding oxidoreductase [Deltaproteobacteria bacterium]|nr:FAD-binding oxidoreductase [Deltaproteobacteria bacterium]